jgi:4,5-dihydroxyphthalate decarboxylase
VFPSRYFLHSGIYVRPDGKISKPEQLAGKRVGFPQWSQTAGIYVRGYLKETVGLDLTSIDWVQAGVNDPGREEPSTLKLPKGIKIRSVADRSLNDLLIAGNIDAIISARAPNSFQRGTGEIIRLFPDYRPVEEDYFRQTQIFPIMHTIAIRRDVYEANRWIARNLFKAFEEAKDRSVARMLDATAAHVPLPWSLDLAERAGRDLVFKKGGFWPYGIKDNMPTLEAFLRFTFDQGTTHRKLTIEDIFAEEALAEIRV